MILVMAKVVDLIFILFVFFGIFYTFLPHSVHVKYSPDWLIGINLTHDFHVFIGIILIILSIYFYRNFIIVEM